MAESFRSEPANASSTEAARWGVTVTPLKHSDTEPPPTTAAPNPNSSADSDNIQYPSTAGPGGGSGGTGGSVVGGGSVSLCYNGVSVTPHRATSVEQALAGSDLSDGAIDAALAGLSIEEPLEDLHASGEYRVHLARVYGGRALRAARDR